MEPRPALVHVRVRSRRQGDRHRARAEDEVHVWDAATGKSLRSSRGRHGRSREAAKLSAEVTTVHNCQLADFVIAETRAGWQKLDVKTGKWTDDRRAATTASRTCRPTAGGSPITPTWRASRTTSA